MAEMTMRDMENRVKALEGRLGRLELELQNKVGKSLTDLHTMYKDQSDALDQMTLLIGKLIKEVFPKKEGTPDFQLT